MMLKCHIAFKIEWSSSRTIIHLHPRGSEKISLFPDHDDLIVMMDSVIRTYSKKKLGLTFDERAQFRNPPSNSLTMRVYPC
jgi:hypothetical protein